MKKILVFFAMLFICCCSFGLIACENESEKTSENNSEKYAIYQTYVVYAEDNGETPLSYDEWLATIKGEKGDKGDVGEKGDKGDKGDTGATGQDGKGIVSVIKTSTVYNVDIYTITFTDNTTTNFTITNGVNGQDGEQGIQGEQSKAGLDGLEISNIKIIDGKLIITLMDNTEIDCGSISGNNKYQVSKETWEDELSNLLEEDSQYTFNLEQYPGNYKLILLKEGQKFKLYDEQGKVAFFEIVEDCLYKYTHSATELNTWEKTLDENNSLIEAIIDDSFINRYINVFLNSYENFNFNDETLSYKFDVDVGNGNIWNFEAKFNSGKLQSILIVSYEEVFGNYTKYRLTLILDNKKVEIPENVR